MLTAFIFIIPNESEAQVVTTWGGLSGTVPETNYQTSSFSAIGDGSTYVLVDITRAGSATVGGAENAIPPTVVLTNSFDNTRASTGISGNTYTYTFSEPVHVILSSQEHSELVRTENIKISSSDAGALFTGSLTGGQSGHFINNNNTSEIHIGSSSAITAAGTYWTVESNIAVTTLSVEYYVTDGAEVASGEPFTLDLAPVPYVRLDDTDVTGAGGININVPGCSKSAEFLDTASTLATSIFNAPHGLDFMTIALTNPQDAGDETLSIKGIFPGISVAGNGTTTLTVTNVSADVNTLRNTLDDLVYVNSAAVPEIATARTVDITVTDPFGNTSATVTATLALTNPPNSGATSGPFYVFTTDTTADLFNALDGSEDVGGTWIDNDTTGALSGSTLTVSSLPLGPSTFNYVVTGTGPCSDEITTVLVIKLEGSEIALTAPTASSNCGTLTTSYTNPIFSANSDDPIFVFDGGVNVGQLECPAGAGITTYDWYVFNPTTNSYVDYALNSTRIQTGLADGGYLVVRNDGGTIEEGRAWVWNTSIQTQAGSDFLACSGDTVMLNGVAANNTDFTFYDPVERPFTITNSTIVSVTFNVTHTYISDVGYFLVSPDGLVTIPLGLNETGSPCYAADNAVNLTFTNDQTITPTLPVFDICEFARNNACSGAGPALTGTYNAYYADPSNNSTVCTIFSPAAGINLIDMTPLNGYNARQGGWKVQIYDCEFQDFGEIDSVIISFADGGNTSTFTSGTIPNGTPSAQINDDSCNAATASIYEVPFTTAVSLSEALNIQDNIGVNGSGGYAWSYSTDGPTGPWSAPFEIATLTPSVTVNETTWFRLNADNGTMCAGEDVIQVTVVDKPVSGSGTDNYACAGDALVDLNTLLTGADIGGNWTVSGSSPNNPGGDFSAGAGTYDPTTGGVYIFDYTVNAMTPCIGSETTSITISVQAAPDSGTDNTINATTASGTIDLFTNLNGSPDTGGTWSVNGGSDAPGTNFDQSAGTLDSSGLATGTYIFDYTVTSCLASISSVTINFTGVMNDMDNVDEAIEDGAPNGGDGNNDGTPDSQQPDVASIPDANGNYVTIEVTSPNIGEDCNQITSMVLVAEASLASQDAVYEYPYGLIDFSLACAGDGQTATVKYYWYGISSLNDFDAYRKFGPSTAGGSDLDYRSNIIETTRQIENINGTDVLTVTYTITDDAVGDDNTEIAGVIEDPTGPAVFLARDTDGDTIPDIVDLDDDNDGILDTDECMAISGAISPQLDAINYQVGDYSMYVIGGNTNGLGYQESGFQQAAFNRGMPLQVLNGGNEFNVTGATGDGSASVSTVSFSNGTMTYSINYASSTNNDEFRTTTAANFFSGDTGEGVFVDPYQGGVAGDNYTITINFTEAVVAFSLDLIDIFDTIPTGTPNVSYEMVIDGVVVARLNGLFFGDDATGNLTVFDNTGTSQGTVLAGQNIENTISFISEKPVSSIQIIHRVESGSILASARDPHGIDALSFTTVSAACDNNKNTDSDGDGCPDAVEAAGSFTTADLDGDDSLGDTVGTTAGVDEGVPTVAGTGQATTLDVTTIGPDVDNDGIADACDDFNDSDGDGVEDRVDVCPGGDDTADADVDGIPDGCDLDDDNDGILDVDERICDTYTFSQAGSVVTQVAGSGSIADVAVNDKYVFSNALTSGLGNYDILLTIVNRSSSGPVIISASSLLTLNGATIDDNWVEFTVEIVESGSATVATPTGILVTLYNFTLVLGDIDSVGGVDVGEIVGFKPTGVSTSIVGTSLEAGGFDNGGTLSSPYQLYRLRKDIAGNTIDWTDEVNNAPPFGGTSATDFAIRLTYPIFNGGTYVYGSTGSATATGQSRGMVLISDTTSCVDADFDMDNVPNALDIDSDNDGIYDVVEANGTDVNNDGIADGLPDTVTGIPSSAGTGLSVVETTSGTSNHLNTDSDGDGCSDANEYYNDSSADGSDGGQNQYGTGEPAAVNTNGTVIAASYPATAGDTDTNGTADYLESGPDPDTDTIANICDLDDDNDGNPDSTDTNPQTPVAEDDAANATAGVSEIIQILSNDDFTDNTDGNSDPDNNDPTSITTIETVAGANTTATGSIVYDPATGELTYTPTFGEGGSTVTIEYRVCNDVNGDSPGIITDDVCDTAIVRITVAEGDQDGDGVLDSVDICPNGDDTADIDADGVPDFCDLDDDNDGIPDAIENTCAVTEPLAGAANNIAVWEHQRNNLSDFFVPVGLNSTYISSAGPETAGAGLTIAPVSTADVGFGNLTISDVDQPDLASAQANGDYLEYSFVAGSQPWRVGRLFAFDTPPSVFSGGGTIYNGYDITIEMSNDNFATSTLVYQDTDNPQDINPGHAGENYFTTSPTDVFIDAGSAWKIRIYFYGNPVSNAGNATWDNFVLAGRLCIDDFDGDGIPNNLDLDSDNDGIYDTAEAGGTDADNDGIADGIDNDDNGIPDSAGIGLTPTDSGSTLGTPDFLDSDSDDDGCSDANEYYGDDTADGGDGGEYGSDPAAVNANGTVTAASYPMTGVDTDSNGTADYAEVGPDPDMDGTANACDLDDDNDGNPDTSDSNPLTPVAEEDNATAMVGISETIDIITNDDFVADNTGTPGSDIYISDAGTGTGVGIINFDENTGELIYTPAASESGMSVTV
ncbi:choice-of-anchor U domain-containing protein, partial [uncultured Kordia sp.]|uniref:choice-of-anchor U domain-containing protein n=1 Tax=uncultured Kordia sp. TaxID=507699 RepID=UPI0026112E17